MFRFAILTLSFLILPVSSPLGAQTKGVNRDKYRINIRETSEEIHIDGILDEEIWKTAEKAGHLQRVLPIDTGFAIAQTEVMMTYNETTLYLGITCFDPTPGKRPVESLRRDFNFGKNDNFIVFIDTFNDQTNGFAFGISPAGAQWDGVQADGGTVNLNWDIKWRSEVKNYDDRWTAEFAIPFRSIRYNGGEREWGINFSRQDLKTNEKSSWAPMPRQFATATLAYTGTLLWDKPLPSSGLRFSLIPYISGKATHDKLEGEEISSEPSAGFDAKAILSTSLNLDLTVNPDYSQVEVDEQVTNLDRFELFFPEKRQFYLENSDLFASLGTETVRPFFSRRIGLDSPVRAGARLSGKMGNKWRIGVMDIQTGSKDSVNAANYMVSAIQKQVFSRSSITAFLVNKQVMATEDLPVSNERKFNRIGGLEYNLSSPDNLWTGKVYYHQDILGGAGIRDAAMAANIQYFSQFIKASINQSVVGEDYNAETGYIRRKGYYQINPEFQYKFFPHSSSIANHGPQIDIEMFFSPHSSFELTDRETEFSYNIEWLNRNLLSLEYEESFIKLDHPFDPTNTGGLRLESGEKFQNHEVATTFTSDVRKLFNFEISARYGGYYNGTRLSLNSKLFYRVQPYGSLAMATSYNEISLPYPYNDAKLFLIGPRFDFTFTDRLFFTSFLQYNNQIDNLNLNLRFQWRFAPVSDLYIVYTENSFPEDYRIKNRGLVVKLSYWFN